MTRSRLAFTLVMMFAISAAVVPAAGQPQTGLQPVTPRPPEAPTPATGTGTRNVQVEVSVKLEGSGPPITKQMTLVGADGSVSMGRAGMDVPVAVGPSNQYRSVGLNVDARPRLVEGGRIGLFLKLEFSAVLKAEGATSASTPSFGSSKTELNLVLDSGKPLVIAHAADAEVGRGYTVEVKATLLR